MLFRLFCEVNISGGAGIHSYGEAVDLQNYLLLCRSITHAQRMRSILERAGISGQIFRPPVALTERGCSYAVRIGTHYLPEAMRQLRQAQILPERVFYAAGDGGYREIFPQ